MRRAPFVALVLVAVVGPAGCRTGPDQVGNGRRPTPPELPELAETSDIYTPPSGGRFTLNLVSYIVGAFEPRRSTVPQNQPTDPAAEEEERQTRETAEATAKQLRQKDIPAFILTRSVAGRHSKAERVPVFHVCAGSFQSFDSEEARSAKAYFQGLRVGVGGGAEPKRLFQGAHFILLDTRAAAQADDLLSLYDVPDRARYGVAVGLFQGPRHKQLAQDYAHRLRDQGYRPLIQATENDSRVVLGATEFKNDPRLGRIAAKFPRVTHNLIGYIAFRGKSKEGLDHVIRARATARDLQEKGYGVFVQKVRIKPPGGPRGVTIEETRVLLARREGSNLTLDDLLREYREVEPSGVERVAYRSQLVDLRSGPWNVDVINPRRGPLMPLQRSGKVPEPSRPKPSRGAQRLIDQAEALEAAGYPKHAIAKLRELIARYPDSAEARTARERLQRLLRKQ